MQEPKLSEHLNKIALSDQLEAVDLDLKKNSLSRKYILAYRRRIMEKLTTFEDEAQPPNL